MTGRYCFNPMTAKRIGRRLGLIDRIRRARAFRRAAAPDLYPVIGYESPVYPGK